MNLLDMLPPRAARAIAWMRARAARLGGDRGVATLEAIILIVGLAGLAVFVVAAVTGKLHAWVSQIPG